MTSVLIGKEIHDYNVLIIHIDKQMFRAMQLKQLNLPVYTHKIEQFFPYKISPYLDY